MSTPTSDSATLVDQVDGTVIGPGDPPYDDARQGWNLAYTHRPALIVDATSVGDVVATVRYAASQGLTVAVQATGHGVTAPADDAVLLLTRRLDHVQIHPATATATVGGGATWAPVLAAAQKEGLAPLVGSSPHVGAVGYTLGGGFGWLGRRYGLAADHVRSFTVVRADGWVVHASATSHPELFWALRGGGAGSLGVVVEMEIDLMPVATVYAGNLLYPLESAADVFDFYATWSADLPTSITSAFNITTFPPLDIVPEPLRGRTFAIVRGCHCGDMAEATALIDRWRRWRAPAIDLFGPMPFAEMAAISQDPVDPVPAISSGRWVTGLDPTVLEAMLEAVSGGGQPSPILFTEARHAGGAIADAVPGASYAARGSDWLLQVVGMLPDRQAADDATHRVRRLWDRLESRIPATGAYLNFTEGAERLQQTRQAFDTTTWDRLVAVKQDVDPGGLFAHGLHLSG